MVKARNKGDERPPLIEAAGGDLLMSKQIEPLKEEQLAKLRKLATYDVSTYSEADVRAVIIDPVVEILGYEKEQHFSVNREKHLKVLDADLFVDYELLLWQESFWVIEAKKVKRKKLKFHKNELLQTLAYAAHPAINAALMVLCDGRVFEIYDREQSLTNPIERVEVARLAEDFEKLQRYLAPWQAWFFQKRRVPRFVAKVMNREMTAGRIDDLRSIINRQFDLAQDVARENRRQLLAGKDQDKERRDYFASLELPDLVEHLMFDVRSHGDINTIVKAAVDKGGIYGQQALLRIFDDRPRNINDTFICYSLRVLIEYESRPNKPSWLPHWLLRGAHSPDLEAAIKNLIRMSLTSFSEDKPRQIVLQYSASVRRLAKIILAIVPAANTVGTYNHQQIRHIVDELNDLQMLTSPARESLISLDRMQHLLTNQFVYKHRDARGGFDLAGALTALKDIWTTEKMLLGDGTGYKTALKGRGLDGEVHPTEFNWVAYDNLGHTALCALQDNQKWAHYIQANHRDELLVIARMGSWRAREMLGEGVDLTGLSDQHYADRFFHGALELYQSLRTGYNARSTV
ncbi:hypothetical protein EIQ10_18900 [Xanthomonas campestris pv. campestris]